MKNILERLKTDKDFRFDFIIAVWSGIIILAVFIALIWGIIYATGKINNSSPEETDVPVYTEEPADIESPSPKPAVTTAPDDEDYEDDEKVDESDIDSDDEENESNKNSNGSSDNTSASNDTVYATTTVNVRADATTESASLGKISAGTGITRTENLSNGWSKVLYNGKTAYIKSEFLSSSPVSAATSAPAVKTQSPNTQNSPSKTKAPANVPKPTKKPDDTTDNTQNSADEPDSYDTTEPPTTDDNTVISEPTSAPPVSDTLTGTDALRIPSPTAQ